MVVCRIPNFDPETKNYKLMLTLKAKYTDDNLVLKETEQLQKQASESLSITRIKIRKFWIFEGSINQIQMGNSVIYVASSPSNLPCN